MGSLDSVLIYTAGRHVKLTWIDSGGLEHVIYPAINTSNPLPILQDGGFRYTFDQENRELLIAEKSETKKRFDNKSGSSTVENARGSRGRAYGLTPSNAQSNGVFYIDQISGIIYFDSSLSGKIITLK